MIDLTGSWRAFSFLSLLTESCPFFLFLPYNNLLVDLRCSGFQYVLVWVGLWRIRRDTTLLTGKFVIIYPALGQAWVSRWVLWVLNKCLYIKFDVLPPSIHLYPPSALDAAASGPTFQLKTSMEESSGCKALPDYSVHKLQLTLPHYRLGCPFVGAIWMVNASSFDNLPFRRLSTLISTFKS